MKSALLLLILLISLNGTGQDFFRENFDNNKTYILLANPTSANLKTVKFLSENKLLRVNPRKVIFVGVYHENQNYNFRNAASYIQTEGLNNFFLHEIRDPLNENNLFEKNELTDELKHLFLNSSGIFFFGGPDIPPSVYGEENTLSVVTDPERHYFESTFLFHLLGGFQNQEFTPFLEENPEYFVTGFCLGLQTMNVATGGTLIQDIPAEIYQAYSPQETVDTGKENMHRNYWQKISNDPQIKSINFHTIQFTDHPFFLKKVKINKSSTPLVYSSHHQAVKKPGKGMEITAYSSDGKIVEGLAHKDYPHVFSVQFHPEVPSLYEDRDAYKFAPDDDAKTYHQNLSRKDLKFHKKYWKHISKSIKKASN